MPTDFKVLRRGSVWGPLITGPEERVPASQAPVRVELPYAALARGWSAIGPRILDAPAQPDPGWREGLIAYGSPPPPPQGQATFGRRILDEVAQPDPAWRQPLTEYGAPPPIPGGSATFGRRIMDEVAQPDPGWREGLTVYGSPAPPPAGLARFGPRILDEIPRAGWAMAPIVVGGPSASAPAIAYGSPPPAPEGATWFAPVPRDVPVAIPVVLSVLETTVIYGPPARPFPGLVIRTDWSRDGSSEPYPTPDAGPYGPAWTVFDDILARLDALGCFASDGVGLGAPAEVLQRSGRQYPACAIQPTTWTDLDTWDDGDRVVQVGFTLTLIARDEEPDRRLRQLDWLGNRCRNALNGQSLAGITFKSLTRVQRGQYAPTPAHPEQRSTLTGQFTFEVVGWDALDETEPT